MAKGCCLNTNTAASGEHLVKAKMIEKTCKHCGKTYKVHNYRAKTSLYCSASCRSSDFTSERAAHWKGGDIEQVCQFCGKVYKTKKAHADITKYCSHSCQSKASNSGSKSHWWKGGKQEKTCQFCGKVFYVYASNAKGTYCSKSCLDAARRKRVTRTCLRCGNTFERKASRANRYRREYCSFACYILYAVGVNSAQWRGGDKVYPPTFNRQFKEAIRERDNYTCAICKGYGDDVHHINYVKKDTHPENCITLCHSCHAKTNHNRSYWISYFLERGAGKR